MKIILFCVALCLFAGCNQKEIQDSEKLAGDGITIAEDAIEQKVSPSSVA